ncbi:MAG: hypothetical protein ABIX01_05660 [Chitinophagaceae bacterium]
MFSADFCQAYICDLINALRIIDIKKNVIYVGIRMEGGVKLYAEELYAEDGSTAPPALATWSDKPMSIHYHPWFNPQLIGIWPNLLPLTANNDTA